MIKEAMFYGPGAGGYETASAVVSDMINSVTVKSECSVRPEEYGLKTEEKADSAYYIRFNAHLSETEAYLASEDIQFDIISTAETAVKNS